MEIVLGHKLTDHGHALMRERMDVSRDVYGISVHYLAGDIFPLPDLNNAAGIEARVQYRENEAASWVQELRQRREQRRDGCHIHESHRTDCRIELFLSQTHQSVCARTVHDLKINPVARLGRPCPRSFNHALGEIHAEYISAQPGQAPGELAV